MTRDLGPTPQRGHVVSGEPLHREDLAIWRLGLAVARSREAFARWGVGDPYRTSEKDAEIDAAWAAYIHRRQGRATPKEQATLSSFLMAGLKVRANDSARLSGSEVAVYLQLREFHCGSGLRVCVGGEGRSGPGCFRIYTAQRTPKIDRCKDCHKSPIRWPPRPGDLVAWADPWDSSFRRIEYTRHCAACDREFATSRIDTEHCANCRGPAASARRRRGGTAHGRQEFRYARTDGQDFTLSLAIDSEGHAVPLESVGGVVTTADAEIAKRLEALGLIAIAI